MDLLLLIDADSLPLKHRQLILRRAVKNNVRCIFAADRKIGDVEEAIKEHTIALRSPLRGTLSKEEIRRVKSTIELRVVESGANAADDCLVELCQPPCLAVTHDIPLASRLIEKGAVVLDDRGDILTHSNIGERLSIRDAMYSFREAGIFNEKQKRMTSSTLQEFAAAFDKEISKFGV